MSTQLTLSDICHENSRRFPDHDAVVDGDVRFTWKQFDERVTKTAALLTELGVRRGDRVLWLAQSSYRFLELMIAASRVGAMICPANWRQSADEMAFVVDDFDPALVVWQDEEIGETVAGARAKAGTSAVWIQSDSDAPDGYDARVEAISADLPASEATADDALLHRGHHRPSRRLDADQPQPDLDGAGHR